MGFIVGCHRIIKENVPISKIDFDRLRSMTRTELHALGMRPWSAESGLLLFPSEWYSQIPEGYEIVDISGGTQKFKNGVTDDGHRFGFLAFGVVCRQYFKYDPETT